MASIVSAGTTSATSLNLSADTTGILQLASNNGTVGLTVDTSQRTIIASNNNSAVASAGILQINQTGSNATQSSIGFNGSDNSVISTNYALIFQVNNTNAISNRYYEWRNGGKGYSDGTALMYLDSGANLAVGTSSVPSSFTGGLVVNGAVAFGQSSGQTGSFTVGANIYYITMYSLTGTATITLPTPATNTGRQLWIRVQANQAVNSASSNVTTLAGGAVTNSILTATAGKWAFLICDGSYWNIVAAN